MGRKDEKAILALIFLIITGGFFVLLYFCKGLWHFITIPDRKKKYAERQQHLLQKYQDPELVTLLLNGNIWVNQTSEQLIDSLGNPIDIDQKVLKTKKEGSLEI